ncbi:MAG: PAS domain-containing protein [Proteobacteria bacterium]|nr:PAS domain-containing protein [Pseudomonadota bacterium]
MAAPSPRHGEVEDGLALAVVRASPAPLLLLDGDLRVVAASASFCEAFGVDLSAAAGVRLFELGQGEWNVPALWLLLDAVLPGNVETETHEMDLQWPGLPPRRLLIEARRLAYGGANARLLLAACDVTEARVSDTLKDDLLREKTVLLQELQHRIANSLQIIASLLLHSARTVVSDETRGHLQDAHSRVMSVAALQQHLAASRLGAVELRAYFTDLCASIGKAMIRDPDQLSIEVVVDDSLAPANVSVSLGLIVTELVINALKHAFPGHRSGRIVVRYETRGSGWILSVADDGAGFSSAPASVSTGLGTSIVEALSKRLGARVEITHCEPGTLVSIICEGPVHAH